MCGHELGFNLHRGLVWVTLSCGVRKTSHLQSGDKELFSCRDPSVSKSIERIFKIWEDRNVYPEETILALKEALSKLLTLCISHLTNCHVSSLKL